MDENKNPRVSRDSAAEGAARKETLRLLTERLGLSASEVDGHVRIIAPAGMDTSAIEAIVQDVNNTFGTTAFMSKRPATGPDVTPEHVQRAREQGFASKDDPNVTAAVTPEQQGRPGPVFTGRLAKLPPMFVATLVKGILDVCAEVSIEAVCATDKHGLFNSPHEGHSVIREELEELFDEVRANKGKEDSARHEAIQIAVTAVKYVLMLGPPFGTARVPEARHNIVVEMSKHV